MKKLLSVKVRRLYMIISVIMCAFAMSFVDGVIQPQYFVKSLIKLGLFLVVPIIYFAVTRESMEDIKDCSPPSGATC